MFWLARTPRREGAFLGVVLLTSLQQRVPSGCHGSSRSPEGAALVSHTPAAAKAMTFDITSAPSAQRWTALPGCPALGGEQGAAAITASLTSSFSPSHGAREAPYCKGQPWHFRPDPIKDLDCNPRHLQSTALVFRSAGISSLTFRWPRCPQPTSWEQPPLQQERHWWLFRGNTPNTPDQKEHVPT